VNIEPESSNTENRSPPESSLTSPASADTAPVMVPGAPPPPPSDAVEAGEELREKGPIAEGSAAGTGVPAETSESQVVVEDEDEDEPDVPFRPPLELIDDTIADEDLKFDWFILKVQVNREDSIKDALLRRVKMNDLERYFKEIVVPTEDVVEFTKTGKKRVVKKKLYPGYILVNMAVTDESWFMVRETPGIGDFTGALGRPTPMDPKDVERILRSSKVLPEEEGVGIKTTIPFETGNRVRVKEGYFQNFEGDVDAIDQANGRVTVMINIFGRSTPVELEHWQIEKV
jgi:transcription termination/antitermination protein NusG